MQKFLLYKPNEFSQGTVDSDLSPPASAPQPEIHDPDDEEEEDGIEGTFPEC